MYVPSFIDYNKNQVILTSDRVILHSKSDCIFLFGSQAVSLSSKGSINLDTTSNGNVIVNSPKIELGINSQIVGSPIILSKIFVPRFQQLMKDLWKAADKLSAVDKKFSAESYADSMTIIQQAGIDLKTSVESFQRFLKANEYVSKTTFTL